MAGPLNTVALTRGFLADAKAEGMTGAEIEAMVQMLAAHPDAGDLVRGSGGMRKVRVAGRGHGKSGGFRVLTFHAAAFDMPVYAMAVLSKGARANFSAAEADELAKVGKAILVALRSTKAG